MRQLSSLDHLLCEVDTALRTLLIPKQRVGTRPCPGSDLPNALLSADAKKHVVGLMRVNHAGEVCAQALYQGQALTAQLTHIQQQMTEAAAQETDHLSWCEQRLTELHSQPSLLNPIWYAGALLLGAFAGACGDRISLSFVEETERQVSRHLQRHLQRLPKQDIKSKAILTQMLVDETHHADQAKQAGAALLPAWIKAAMHYVSYAMTKTSYYI